MAESPHAPVALGIQVPDSFKTIGNVLNFAHQATDLQRKQATLETDILQRKAESSKAQTEAELASKTLPSEIIRFQAMSDSARTGADQAALALKTRNHGIALNTAAALFTNPAFIHGSQATRTHIMGGAERFLNDQGLTSTPDGPFRQIEALVKRNAAPNELQGFMHNLVQLGTTPQEKGAVVNAPLTPVSTGGEVTPIQLQQGAPNAVAANKPMTMNLPPGSRIQPTGAIDPASGQAIANVYDASGTIVRQILIPPGAPAGSAQAAPPAQAPPQAQGPAAMGGPQAPLSPFARGGKEPLPMSPTPMPFENAESIAAARQLRNDAMAAADKVRGSEFNYNQILKLADQAITGKGAEVLASLGGGYAALPWTTDNASNLKLLGHYLSLETTNLAAVSGVNKSDAGAAISAQQAGSTEWTKDAIKGAARINRALANGAKFKFDGMENAMAAAGNNPIAAREFLGKWTRVAEVNALRLMDLKKNDDREGMASFIKEMGGINSERMKKEVDKVQAINALIRGR